MLKYFAFQNIHSYYCYLIKYNILVLLFKYLNNKFVIIVNILLIRNVMIIKCVDVMKLIIL